MRILQASPSDRGGGAEAIAVQLLGAYRRAGHGSWLAVGLKQGDADGVLEIPNETRRGRWSAAWNHAARRIAPFVGRLRGAGALRRGIQCGIARPRRVFHQWKGEEDFDFPATSDLLHLPPERPDVLHCHNLHGAWLPMGGYFDLSALPRLSRESPAVLTLHDAWLLSGHCAHSFDCERWTTGCGVCPYPDVYPAVRRDNTAGNWQRKRDIYAQCRIYVATPSAWLMNKIRNSMLAPAIAASCVIPNGIALDVFRPAEREAARRAAGIPGDVLMLLFSANTIRRNEWKDYSLLRKAIEIVGVRSKHRCQFVGLGDQGPEEQFGNAGLRFVPFRRDPVEVAWFYQAADVYVHPARVDTFPTSILEALACGVPVVATSVGGIPEQLREERTGLLVPSGDSSAMAAAILRLLENGELRAALGRQAAEDARQRFDIEETARRYVAFYLEAIEDFRNTNPLPPGASGRGRRVIGG